MRANGFKNGRNKKSMEKGGNIMNKENKIKFGTVIAVVTVGYVGYLSARYLNKKLNIVNNIKKLISK